MYMYLCLSVLSLQLPVRFCEGAPVIYCFASSADLSHLFHKRAVFLTWYKIKSEAKKLSKYLGREAQTIRASHSAAKRMSLLVAAFVIQWGVGPACAIWALVSKSSKVPNVVVYGVVVLFNIGGILNGAVYLIIRRRKLTSRKTVQMNVI